MQQNQKSVLYLSLFAVLCLLALQVFWVNSFYKQQRINFERQVNLLFEDALKREFARRCDTIAADIEAAFMDTTEYGIFSRLNNQTGSYEYFIRNNRNKINILSFSSNEYNKPFVSTDTVFKKQLAREYAQRIKSEDLENHMLFYRLENLGVFLTKKVREIAFDTARLRPVLQQLLHEKNIDVPFSFWLNYKDSTTNFSIFPDSITKKYPVITRSYPTYKWWSKEEQFVRGLFVNPDWYVFSQLKWIITAAVFMVLITAFCIYVLFKKWQEEKKAAAVKDDFVNNITHELKTPVATVTAAIEALTLFNETGDKEKTTKYLSYSSSELSKLNSLINKILDVSLYNKKGVPLQKEPVDIAATITTVSSTFNGHSKNIQFIFNRPQQIPAIVADPFYFTQAITNIFQNAVNYCGEAVTITTSVETAADTISIIINDTGPGISKNDLPFIYDQFYRGPTKNHQVKGHGLGLYFVKKIMEAHGGSIHIQSDKTGTKVTLTWPK